MTNTINIQVFMAIIWSDLQVNIHSLKYLFVLLIGIIYQPLPDNFPQPWKYRFLSYWAHRIDQLGFYCEQMNLFTRINLIRNLHYLSIGLFQKRHPECRLKVYDRKIANVHVRIYEPEESIDHEEKTTIIYFHGGGFLLGSIETYDQATYRMANLTRTTLFAVEIFTIEIDQFRYRLAPEHRFPSGLEDCLSVSRELFENGHNYKINSNRIIMSGDSAGGNLALVVSHLLINVGHTPYLLSLLYPSLQFFDFTLPSYRTYLKQNILGVLNENNLVSMVSLLSENEIQITSDFLLNSHLSIDDKTKLYPFIDPNKYLSIAHDFNISHEGNESLIKDLKYLLSPLMSPLLVSDEQLLKLPTILLFTTEFDILRDEGFIFASRLNSLNKTIYHHHFSNAFHGAHAFLYGPLSFEIAHHMIEHTAQAIKNHL
ncbi:unnamed protein product [Rotaria magnacalcarata]|uniref:Alpha/beta hydrolase fold-3 domain-containing protein n=2 Tax=Rotaria magnacalcarata TaxID=392030 RepID=A0A819DT18_9BILA|nr:unnamed protein product [Rotaria magnacalcarata]CAF3805796.1 unnamed protein product [Rotaria magnacalcarata]CAF3839347.1 unnamed protein product [Rotaria magnacalcarata]